MQMDKLSSSLDLEKLRESILKKSDQPGSWIVICQGTGCCASGAKKITLAFKEEINKQGLKEKLAIRTTGCHGFCEAAPLAVAYPKKIFYQHLTPKDVPEIVSETVVKGKIIERLLYVDPVSKEKIITEDELPFYKKQKRVLLLNNGKIDPNNIQDYIALNGYSALSKILFKMNPDEVIEEIKKSGLRGRGGGGFPTGRKWESARKACGDIKYVICNADEGDPGAFQDLSLLEGNPHSILEGMIIGAYAIGSCQGYIYVRGEYPLAIKIFGTAIEQAKEFGLLGKNILGSNFDFTVKISRGCGAFVCGESSALIASIEGKVGEPRAKHIHMAESGLWEKPTVVNNVKTWASVPVIINKGADWYSQIGTQKSKGTMIFSLVGKINNTGLVEVPLGTTIRELIYNVGGGIPQGKRFKAVQTGGPSGGCIPESLIDLPLDYEKLSQAGSMMGSGAMIVMDEDTCMVNVAKYFLNFTMDESCGKCTSCRVGIKLMHQILSAISEGRGQAGDIELLEEISAIVSNVSLCSLGKTAPNPVLTTIRYFRDEYEAHIKDKKCPGRVCKKLLRYAIEKEKCTGCHLCYKDCSEQAIVGEAKNPHKIIQEKCVKCGACYDACKFKAVRIE